MHPQLPIIEKASHNLFYLSEADAPFELLQLQNNQEILPQLLHLSGKGSVAPVETVSLEHFFRNQVKIYPEASEDQKQVAERFLQLQSTLQQTLSNIKVYRIGATQIDAFIVGQLADGSLGGLGTKLVET